MLSVLLGVRWRCWDNAWIMQKSSEVTMDFGSRALIEENRTSLGTAAPPGRWEDNHQSWRRPSAGEEALGTRRKSPGSRRENIA